MKLLYLTIVCLLVPLTVKAQKPELTTDTIEKWRDHILPVDDDLSWQQIPWMTTFSDGIKAANDADKPLLLWTMNGHPLGCT